MNEFKIERFIVPLADTPMVVVEMPRTISKRDYDMVARFWRVVEKSLVRRCQTCWGQRV